MDRTSCLHPPARRVTSFTRSATRSTNFELPDVKERLKNFDYLLALSTPEELDRILRADIGTFSEVVTLAGLRAK
jgi:tripartite-type tricarboxylate transporter receptor subunit TctC